MSSTSLIISSKTFVASIQSFIRGIYVRYRNRCREDKLLYRTYTTYDHVN